MGQPSPSKFLPPASVGKSLDDRGVPFFKRFEDVTLNVSDNCPDRQLERGLADPVAIIFEPDGSGEARVTYGELLARTCRLANALKARGVKEGDRVVNIAADTPVTQDISTLENPAVLEQLGERY